MCVCACVCVCAFAHAYMHVCKHVCTRIFVCMYAHRSQCYPESPSHLALQTVVELFGGNTVQQCQ